MSMDLDSVIRGEGENSFDLMVMRYYMRKTTAIEHEASITRGGKTEVQGDVSTPSSSAEAKSSLGDVEHPNDN